MNRLISPLLLILVLSFIATPIAAQTDTLDPAAPAEHGGLALGVGFAPDPFRIPDVIGGGALDSARLALGAGCEGFVRPAPDFRVNIVYPFGFLRVIFIADSLLDNTTLLIRAPDGAFTCSDDAFSVLNPAVDLRDVALGEYAIWVGDAAPNVNAPGELFFTSSELVYPSSTGLIIPFGAALPTPTPPGVAVPTRVPGSYMSADAKPTGSAALAHGFLPDPYWREAYAGGDLPVPPHDAGAGECVGYTTAAPAFQLAWEGRSTRLRFFFAADAPDANVSMAVRDPHGAWTCNRDFAPGQFAPQVEYINPTEGVYSVWLAHEDAPNVRVAGVLYTTEKTFTPAFVPDIVRETPLSLTGFDPAAPPRTAALTLDMPFAPDPYPIAVAGSGTLDLLALHPDADRHGCAGYYDAAPSAVFAFSMPAPAFALAYQPDAPDTDAAMVVRTPDGRWWCSDDANATRSPALRLPAIDAAGTYAVWVGNFASPAPITGTLTLSAAHAAE